MKGANMLKQYDHHFHAMGTTVSAWLWMENAEQARAALLRVQAFFARAEARFSRFRPQSELCAMNRSAGRPFAASAPMFALVGLALAWQRDTHGIYDPTILHALEAAGYDRSLDLMVPGRPIQRTAPAVGAIDAQAYGAEVILGPAPRILLPAGVGIDLGGIAKGWTAQEAVRLLAPYGPAMVDAGGDIAALGVPPDGAWTASVAHPLEADKDIAVLGLHNGAVATSSRVRRRWTVNGMAAHHLIDPRTGAPADTAILSVTVVGKRLPDVEIHAKVALILGEHEGVAYLEALQDISALLTTDDGRFITTNNFEERAYVSTSRFADRFCAA